MSLDKMCLWLRHLNTDRLLRSWHDTVAIAETSMLSGDIPLTWLINNCNDNTTWAKLESGLKQRFGHSEQTTESNIPEAMKQDLMLENMKPGLRKQVTATIPKSL